MGARGMMKYKMGVWIVVLGFMAGWGASVFGEMEGYSFTIGQTSGEPYFYATVDSAGYSDAFYYGPSDLHSVDRFHELLSGEWGAAIYYDGIGTDLIDPVNPSLGHKAMWLTRQFQFPNWNTNSQFSTYGTYGAWHDNTNPAPGPNTGQSVIRNGKVEITIDYEVVDLEFLNPLYYPIRSPLSFLDPITGQPGYVNSDRYCFLQTYTVRNIDPADQSLTNLRFYQMLHSHGADEYQAAVSSTYSTVNPIDPLQYYTPRNSVHQVGNFRYDITQWNNLDSPHSTRTHTDFNGFSSTRQPDWIDNGLYEGGHSYAQYKPPTGTHIHIENRDLNNVDHLYDSEVAGAMGWNLGTLDPNETTSITIAYMFGEKQEIISPILLTKTDDIDPEGCVGPGDSIPYTICWNNTSSTDANNVVLIDYLPKGVTYPVSYSLNPDLTMESSDPNFHEEGNYYRWDIGVIPGGATGCVELTVFVTNRAEPGMPIVNRARMTTGNLGSVEVIHYTPGCCWDTSGIIYVDQRATGYDNGTSWDNAYTDLQKALARAQAGCWTTTEIRVAQGRYDPGRDVGATFAIPAGVSIYGGYRGGPVDPNDRRPKVYRTILTGLGDNTIRNESIVTMGNNSLLDGVTVRDADNPGQGVRANGVTYMLSNCIIEDNLQYGIRGIGCHTTIRWCTIRNNTWHGIFQDGTGNTITVDNCHISENERNGIYVIESNPEVINCVICRNGISDIGFFGIWVENPKVTPIFHNNTLAYNRNAAISYFDNDPNYVHQPDIQNCILWYNNQTGNGAQFAGHRPPTHYSCVYDPNDPAGTSTALDANFNFSHKPDFAYSNEPNNVHLAADSFCIDKGNPNLSYTGQLDIDGEERVMGTFVDVGADEVNPECNDVYHSLDWNADGVVNLVEFEKFSLAWMTYDPNNPLCDPNHPNFESDPNSINFISETDKQRFDPVCDLDQDLDVDLADLVIFAEDSPQNWLWVACWRLDLQPEQLEQIMMSMAPSGGIQMQSASLSASAKAESITPEKSVKEQILDLEDTIQFLKKLWLDDPSIHQEIHADEWEEFMQRVYDSFNELKTIETKTLDVLEESL